MYISNKACINGIVGVIYQMHPYHKPEGIDVIIDKIQQYYTDNCQDSEKDRSFKLLDFKDYKEFETILDKILKSIPEFTRYNISKAKQEEGVTDAEDPRNSGYMFTDRYSEPKAYYNFIDLDACVRNISIQIWNSKEADEDCFLCKYAKKYGSMEPGDERCNTCSCNPSIRFKREPHPMSIKPKNQWTKEEIEKYSLD